MGKLFTFWLLLLLSSTAWSQEPDLSFHHITEANGLSYNIVNCFLKDSRGLLWIGTYNGLNRYDGSHFRIFRKEQQSNSLSDNTVHDLAEDKQGNIWGATESGIFRYNPNTGLFKNYLTLPEKETQVVNNIVVDKNGIIWASNINTVVRYDPKTDSFSNMLLEPSSQTSFRRFFAPKNGLIASPDGKGLWIATRYGLLYYDIALQQLINADNKVKDDLFTPNSASALSATRYGHYWYYDNHQQELVGFDPLAKKVQYKMQLHKFINPASVATIFEDRDHMLWLSTWSYEIYKFDYLHKRISLVSYNKANRTSIAGDFFWDAIQEEDGTLWLGTVGGISRLNTQRGFYKIHSFPDTLIARRGGSFDFVSGNKTDDSWWLGTTNYLLLQYNPQTGKTVVHDLAKMPKSRNGLHPFKVNNIISVPGELYMFCNPGIWVKKGNKNFEPFYVKGIPDSVVIHQGMAVNDSIFWLADRYKMWKWNRISNSLQKFEYASGVLVDSKAPYTHFLSLSSDGEPWQIIADDQFAHPLGNTLVAVQPVTKKLTGSIGYYTALSADNAGNLWVVKKGEGLCRFYPKTGAYELYRQYNGLVMDHIMDATADSAGRVWTAAYNQFSVFNPVLKSFTNFTLPINENRYGYENYMTTLPNGHVLSTVGDKVVEFFPNKLASFSVTLKPVISAMMAGTAEKPLLPNAVIHLAPDENDLRFQFGLLIDREDSPFDMQYMLEGADKTWSMATAGFDAAYNKLAPGNYTFRVRAIAKDKGWQTNETKLELALAAPFYRTVWFMLLMLAIISAGIFALYSFRLQKHRQVILLESKAQLLEKEKAMVMFENLKQQLNPHFLFNSLTSLSGLIETDQTIANEFLDQMSGIYRYILKHADSEKVSVREELEFVRLYIHLQQTRFEQGLQVKMDVPDEYMHYKIAPVTLQNLIENAIKHNVIDAVSPLVIKIYVDDVYLVVENNLQKKRVVETSNKKGLAQFSSLYRFLSDRPVLIEQTNEIFKISIPLI